MLNPIGRPAASETGTSRAPRRRAGFTLPEVLVAVAIVAMLAAVVVPTIRGRYQDAYENALIAEFSNIETAVAAYRQDMGRYPTNIDYLYDLPASPKDRCGNTLIVADTLKWHGPYVSRVISTSASYLFAQKDTVKDSLFTEAANVMGIHVYGPDLQTVQNIDAKIDGVVNAISGKLKYSSNTSGSNTDYLVTYLIPMKSGSC